MICGVNGYAEHPLVAMIALDGFQGFALPARSIHSAYSSTFESGNQLVSRTELAWTQLWRDQRFEHCYPMSDIHSQIILCSLDTFVTQPQGHFTNIARCLQDIEGTSVAAVMFSVATTPGLRRA